MKSIILHQHEVTQLSATGEVTVIRVVDKKCQRFENAIPLPEAVETERGLMDFPGMKPGDILFHNGLPIRDGEWQPVSCPFATIGEVRWVRETWDVFAIYNEITSMYEVPSICYKAGSIAIPILGKAGYALQRPDNSHKWRSSTTMPEWASRFKVGCVGIEVKRVSDITETEARAAGMLIHWNGERFTPPTPQQDTWQSYAKSGMYLMWNKLYDKNTDAAEDNPWCWVTTHKKVG